MRAKLAELLPCATLDLLVFVQARLQGVSYRLNISFYFRHRKAIQLDFCDGPLAPRTGDREAAEGPAKAVQLAIDAPSDLNAVGLRAVGVVDRGGIGSFFCLGSDSADFAFFFGAPVAGLGIS